MKTKEEEFFEQLRKVLKALNLSVVRQYVVLKYRIDYYVPDINIAIEYDENNHFRYCEDAERLREEEIKKELGCKFIRISDLDDHYINLRFVVKEILNYLHLNQSKRVFKDEFILKRKRYEKGISSKDITKEADISSVTLKKYEKGYCHSMTLRTLRKLVDVLDLSPEEVLELINESNSSDN